MNGFFAQFAPVSRKILAQALTALFVLVATYLSSKQGGIAPEQATEMSGGLSILAGLVAGWFVRDPETVPPKTVEKVE